MNKEEIYKQLELEEDAIDGVYELRKEVEEYNEILEQQESALVDLIRVMARDGIGK